MCEFLFILLTKVQENLTYAYENGKYFSEGNGLKAKSTMLGVQNYQPGTQITRRPYDMP